MTYTAQIEWYINRLEKEYGRKKLPGPKKRPNVLDTLILTILSQNTNDINRDRAYENLRKRFPEWEDARKANIRSLRSSIKVGGLANQKASRIKQLLRDIYEETGRLDLEFICSCPLDRASEYLKSIKGVGEKTAAVVLLFSCGKPVFPVDTHVHRLARRLGLIPEKTTAEQAHALLGTMVPENKMYEFHLNLIAHGRKVCHARKPDCTACCLKTKCQYNQ